MLLLLLRMLVLSATQDIEVRVDIWVVLRSLFEARLLYCFDVMVVRVVNHFQLIYY